MKYRFLGYALSLLLFFFAPVFSIAEDANESGEPKKKEASQDYYILVEESLPEFTTTNTTATKLPLLLQWTPASVGVVTGTLFEIQDARVLSDALKNVSGINVQSGFGAFDFFTLRGLDSLSSALILTDGAPEPETTFYHLYNIDHIEVLKGPGSFLYGGNSLSGSVNLIRKQPLFQNLFEITSSYGSFGSYNSTVDFNVANAANNLAFRLNGLWQTSDFYRDDKSNHSTAVNPAFTWRVNNNSHLDFNLEYVHNKYEPDSGLPLLNHQLPDVPRTRSYQSPFDVSDQDIYRVRFDYETKINDSINIRNKFYNTDLKWLTKGTLLLGAFPDGLGNILVSRILPVLDDHQNLLGNQLEAIFSFETGELKHRLLTGFELSRLGDDFTLDVAALPFIDLNHPVETAREPLFFIPGQSQAADSRSIVAAPYVADQITLSEKVRLLAGLRYDVVDFEDKITRTDRHDQRFSPMVGLVYSPLSTLSLYFNAGEAFAPPSSLVVGERRPEETKQFEIGARNQFYGGRLSSSLAAYFLRKKNIAIPDNTGVTRQTGDQDSKGFEFELLGNPAPHWSTSFNYAFNHSELTHFAELVFTGTGFLRIDRSGNTSPFAPRHIVNIWAARVFKSGFGLGVGPRYVSSQFIAEDNAFRIDGYLTMDAVVFYDYKNWRFHLNFKNLTDRRYLTRGNGSNAVTPANPFALYAGIEFRR
jgi:iron complex outermembrane receptor protein